MSKRKRISAHSHAAVPDLEAGFHCNQVPGGFNVPAGNGIIDERLKIRGEGCGGDGFPIGDVLRGAILREPDVVEIAADADIPGRHRTARPHTALAVEPDHHFCAVRRMICRGSGVKPDVVGNVPNTLRRSCAPAAGGAADSADLDWHGAAVGAIAPVTTHVNEWIGCRCPARGFIGLSYYRVGAGCSIYIQALPSARRRIPHAALNNIFPVVDIHVAELFAVGHADGPNRWCDRGHAGWHWRLRGHAGQRGCRRGRQ
jgi:hypothetical protein